MGDLLIYEWMDGWVYDGWMDVRMDRGIMNI